MKELKILNEYTVSPYNSDCEAVNKLKDALPERLTINKWYPISKGTYAYENNKFFYHIVKLENYRNYVAIDDYIVKPNGDIEFDHNINTFFKNDGYDKKFKEFVEKNTK